MSICSCMGCVPLSGQTIIWYVNSKWERIWAKIWCEIRMQLEEIWCIHIPNIWVLVNCIENFKSLSSNEKIIGINIHNDVTLITKFLNIHVHASQSTNIHIIFNNFYLIFYAKIGGSKIFIKLPSWPIWRVIIYNNNMIIGIILIFYRFKKSFIFIFRVNFKPCWYHTYWNLIKNLVKIIFFIIVIILKLLNSLRCFIVN